MTAAGARRRVGEVLVAAGIDLDTVVAADVMLVASELATNAVRHGGGIRAFHARVDGDVLRLSVTDANPDLPILREGGPDRPGGFGWPLVTRLSEHVGVETGPEGKTVTAVLRLV